MVQAAHFPVQSSILSADALAEMARDHYPLQHPVQCRLISRGLNDVYRVESDGAISFLRVTPRGWRLDVELEAEIAVIDDVRQRGLRVAPAMLGRDGRHLSHLSAPEGTRSAILFAMAEGSAIRDIDLRHAAAYGRLAASFHTAVDASPRHYQRFAIDEHHLVMHPMAAIRASLPDGGKDLEYLEHVAEQVARRLADLPRTSPGFGLCHADFHPANVHFDERGQPTLFDFDCAGYGWRAYDLTVFLWNSYGERRPRRWRESRWRAFLRGYQEMRTLPEGLAELGPLFLVARQIWLAGMDAGNPSAWPPQWISREWLRDTVRPIREWCAEHPILEG
jgi:Ser/Thr protein kinase RdoA (MazF antagonist)